ncbi:MAG: nucleotidyltransferase domain-containing protein [Bacteroidota bacterium]
MEMVITFGSYARGNFTEDPYVEKGVSYEYQSDFDLLVVLTYEDMPRKFAP